MTYPRNSAHFNHKFIIIELLCKNLKKAEILFHTTEIITHALLASHIHTQNTGHSRSSCSGSGHYQLWIPFQNSKSRTFLSPSIIVFYQFI